METKHAFFACFFADSTGCRCLILPSPPPACHSHILVVFTWESEEDFSVFSRTHVPSCKAFHQLSAVFRHLRFNLLLSRFWLVTAVRAMLLAAIVANRLGAFLRQQ